MIFNVLSLYREFIEQYSRVGVIGRGCAAGAITINSVDIRDYTTNKHGAVDDYPYGGGAGMVMAAQPVCDCVEAVKKNRDIPVVFFTPRGRTYNTQIAREYSAIPEVILLCGHFEGIDERAIQLCVTDEISMGDYILTGGHIAALCFIDSVSRYVDGVLGNNESAGDESFEHGLLEYEQYTRPYEFRGLTVPDVLLSGHHKNIVSYQQQRSLSLTKARRPDLLGEKADDKEKEE